MSEEPQGPNELVGSIEHQRLTTLINSMADAVLALDDQTNIVLFNAAALNILDVNNISIGSPLADVFKPVDKNSEPVNVNDLVLSTVIPTTNRDLILTYKDGSKINLYVSIAPVRLGYGAEGQDGYVLLLRDITREKSLEEERDEFISVTSHELRTPIAIAEGNISNAIFMANKADVPDNIKAALTAAHDQVMFLADLINDLSTLSRAERDALKIDVETIHVADLLHELEGAYKEEASKKNLNLSSEIGVRVNELHSSRLYVHEILQNFITNALKYTHEGHILIKAETAKNGIKFTVSDSGIGISKADQERVFDKFFRSEDYRTRQANGTGLGLYVTIKLARLLNADLSLESELNQGSSFILTVPNLGQPSA